MKKSAGVQLFALCFLFAFSTKGQVISGKQNITLAAKNVISRSLNAAIANKIQFEQAAGANSNPSYSYKVDEGKLTIKGNSVIALCHGFYDYLKTSDQGMISWSGKNLQMATPWKYAAPKQVTSPYRYHYYMNVVTPGYTTPYWGWNRWQQELDWMALHGMDMPIINSAYEAIMLRVFKRLGLPDSVTNHFFTGPAFQPWNRMGNITGWDGPAPASWYTKQVALTHQVLDRMNVLGMTPIIQSFAGFVPTGITKIYPTAKVTPLIWNSKLPQQYRCAILLPDSANAALYTKIGQLFVQEWQKEFGKGKYFLADCFNEMKVPKAINESEAAFQTRLAGYGDVVYRSIKAANDSAVWTMQTWTFGYQRSDWNKDRLASLVSKVPDNKILFLDLANEYNLDFWHISPNWQYYQGFFNKQWVYSMIPNMGGKTAWNGILKTYAEVPITALKHANKGNLVGFGFAPEGIENNELIYELLSDMGWRDQKIELDSWLKSYCVQRYGNYPDEMKKAYQCFLKSCYGTFTDHPRFRYQLGAYGKSEGSVNKSPEFFKGVVYFLDCANSLKKSDLYKNDAIALSAQYISLAADSIIKGALNQHGEARYSELNKAYDLLNKADKLLQSHPNYRLEQWLTYARQYGDTPAEKNYYMQDARRIITTWAPGEDDYAARMWSGLIASYYIPRMKLTYEAERASKKFDAAAWEENWIKNGEQKEVTPYADPVKAAKEIIVQLTK